MFPRISEKQIVIAKRILQIIESSPKRTHFREDKINPEIIAESTNNYDFLNPEQKLFFDDTLVKKMEVLMNMLL